MFKLKFIKIIILSFLTAFFVIIANINTASINAQSTSQISNRDTINGAIMMP